MTKIVCPIYKNSRRNPLGMALRDGAQRISHNELHALINQFAVHLKRFKVNRGDRVAIITHNCLEEVILLWAIWRLGAVACPLNICLPDETLAKQIKSIRCKLLITNEQSQLANKKISIKKIWLANFLDDIDTKALNPIPRYDLEQPAVIIFTSGTTHHPKAVLQTFGNYYYSALGSNKHIIFTEKDSWLLVLPLYHVGGISILFRTALAGGGIFMPNNKDYLEKIIQEFAITHVSMVTTQLIRILKNMDEKELLQSLKAILLGGSPIPDALLRKAVNLNLPIYSTYGLTEMTSQVATTKRIKNQDEFHKAHILKYRKLKLSPSGEILVKGHVLFKGYIQKFKLIKPFDSAGWFNTRDLGIINSDGTLTVTGRKDNMFVSGGENIQPEEIEKYICQLEGVEQAIVVPIAHEEFGARPIAFIKTKDNQRLNKQKIIEHLKKHLPKYKIPDGILKWPVELEGQSKPSRQHAFKINGGKMHHEGIFN